LEVASFCKLILIRPKYIKPSKTIALVDFSKSCNSRNLSQGMSGREKEVWGRGIAMLQIFPRKCKIISLNSISINVDRMYSIEKNDVPLER